MTTCREKVFKTHFNILFLWLSCQHKKIVYNNITWVRTLHYISTSEFIKKREIDISQEIQPKQLQYTFVWVTDEHIIIEEEEIKSTAIILPSIMCNFYMYIGMKNF